MSRVRRLCRSMNRHLGWYALSSTITGFVVGYFVRPRFLAMLLPVALFFMLYPMMLDIRLKRIVEIIHRPRMLLSALLVNFVICPLFIWAISHGFNFNPTSATAIGLILYSSIPCGGMVLAFTGMLDGNRALAATIMAISLLMSVFMVPFWTTLLVGQSVSIPGMLIGEYLMVIIMLPMGLATVTRMFLLKRHGKETYDKLTIQIREMAGLGLILLCFIMFVLNGHMILGNPALIARIIIPVATLLLILLAGMSIVCRLAGVNEADGIALTISCSAKNNALSLAVAFAVFGQEVAMVSTIAALFAQLPIMISFLRIRKPARK